MDPSIVTKFPNLVNQCVSATTIAGFTCTRSCPSGQTLNATNCTCITTPPISSGGGSGGGGGSGFIDAGPPIVTISWPNSSSSNVEEGTLFTSGVANSGAALNECSGSIPSSDPIWFQITNRGGTIARMNSYQTPVVTSSKTDADSVDILSNALAPASSTLNSLGASVYATLDFRSAGQKELTVNAGGYAPYSGDSGTLKHVSGAVVSAGLNSGSDGTFYPTDYSAEYASQAGWKNPYFGARDEWGNLYFTDDSKKTIRVICYDTRAHAGAVYNYWCGSKEPGKSYRVAGGATTDVDGQGDGADWATNAGGSANAELASPTGIAVDRYTNVYFTEYTRHIVGVVCGTTATGYCNGKTAGTTYRVLGRADSAGSSQGDWTNTGAGLQLNGPIGLDIETSGNSINVYIAEYTGDRIRAACTFNGIGPCSNAVWTNAPAEGSKTIATPDGPTDAKINWNGNVFYTSFEDAYVYAYCTDGTDDDLCNGKVAHSAANIIAGNGTQASTGDGSAATAASVARPMAIVLPKAYADDLGVAAAQTDFRDNNVVFVERGMDTLTSNFLSGGGNAVRVVCGNNAAFNSKGYCLSNRTAGSIYRLAGQYGILSNSSGSGYGTEATSATFANLAGATYDYFKNIAVSSNYNRVPNSTPQAYVVDAAIRLIHLNRSTVNSPTVRYSFTDSAFNTALYCLRLKISTQCYYADSPTDSGARTVCECSATPLANGSSSAWTTTSGTVAGGNDTGCPD